MPKLSAYYHPFICSPPLFTLSGNRKITQKSENKTHHSNVSGCRRREREKNMADQLLSLDSHSKRGGNEHVLTKLAIISIVILMLPHYVEAYKATDEGREWAEEEKQADTGAERESLELG